MKIEDIRREQEHIARSDNWLHNNYELWVWPTPEDRKKNPRADITKEFYNNEDELVLRMVELRFRDIRYECFLKSSVVKKTR